MAGIYTCLIRGRGFLGGSVAKNPPANSGDLGLNPGLRGPLGEGDGNPLQYSCLGNPMDKRAWWTIVYGVAKRVRFDLVTKQQQLRGSFPCLIIQGLFKMLYYNFPANTGQHIDVTMVKGRPILFLDPVAQAIFPTHTPSPQTYYLSICNYPIIFGFNISIWNELGYVPSFQEIT